MKAEGVAVKVAPSLLSGGGSIRWWRSLYPPTTGYRGVPPSWYGLRWQHPVVFAVLTDHRLSMCNPLRGVSATIECIMGVCECVMGKGLTSLKGFEGVMFNV
jgi:hypothetical protein